MLSLCECGAAEPEWKHRITLINKESQSLRLQGLDSFIQLLIYWCTSVFLSTERKVITDIKLWGRQQYWQSNIYPRDQQRSVNKAVFVIAQAGSVVIYNILNNPPQKRQCSVDGLLQGVGQSSHSKSLLSDIFCNRFWPPNTLMPSYTTPHTKALHNQSENTFTLCSPADNTPKNRRALNKSWPFTKVTVNLSARASVSPQRCKRKACKCKCCAQAVREYWLYADYHIRFMVTYYCRFVFITYMQNNHLRNTWKTCIEVKHTHMQTH